MVLVMHVDAPAPDPRVACMAPARYPLTATMYAGNLRSKFTTTMSCNGFPRRLRAAVIPVA